MECLLLRFASVVQWNGFQWDSTLIPCTKRRLGKNQQLILLCTIYQKIVWFYILFRIAAFWLFLSVSLCTLLFNSCFFSGTVLAATELLRRWFNTLTWDCISRILFSGTMFSEIYQLVRGGSLMNRERLNVILSSILSVLYYECTIYWFCCHKFVCYRRFYVTNNGIFSFLLLHKACGGCFWSKTFNSPFNIPCDRLLQNKGKNFV